MLDQLYEYPCSQNSCRHGLFHVKKIPNLTSTRNINGTIHMLLEKYGGCGGNFRVILESHQTLQHDESQSIENCLDDKIEQEPIQSKKIQNT